MAKSKVLVIDDNEKNLKLMRAVITRSGDYDIIDASNAETGIELARTHLPEFILMDIQLPGMNGLDATRVIKSDPALKHTPVIALTSYAMRGDEEKSMKAGCIGHIPKPIDVGTIMETIEALIEKSKTGE